MAAGVLLVVDRIHTKSVFMKIKVKIKTHCALPNCPQMNCIYV